MGEPFTIFAATWSSGGQLGLGRIPLTKVEGLSASTLDKERFFMLVWSPRSPPPRGPWSPPGIRADFQITKISSPGENSNFRGQTNIISLLNYLLSPNFQEFPKPALLLVFVEFTICGDLEMELLEKQYGMYLYLLYIFILLWWEEIFGKQQIHVFGKVTVCIWKIVSFCPY